ncbi:MAG: GNAT superfamily N-acetyltransferase [Saprospiraceae bacterium]
MEIRKMYLLSQYRSKGIGKWILRFLIRKAKKSGYKKLVLQTASVLHSAIALYHQTGFEEVTTLNACPRCDRAFEMYL